MTYVTVTLIKGQGQISKNVYETEVSVISGLLFKPPISILISKVQHNKVLSVTQVTVTLIEDQMHKILNIEQYLG